MFGSILVNHYVVSFHLHAWFRSFICHYPANTYIREVTMFSDFYQPGVRFVYTQMVKLLNILHACYMSLHPH